MTRGGRAGMAVWALLLAGGPVLAETTVGSKAFPESWILGEAFARLLGSKGVEDVKHRSNLGGTEIVFQALRGGSIDLYPEYTGTIAEVILHSPGRVSIPEIRAEMAKQGLGVSDPIGFDDSYALAVTGAAQQRFGLHNLSDLRQHPDLRLGLTHEFLGRADGYPGLAKHYGLEMTDVRGIQHELAYEALAGGRIDATDIYTTDAQIERLGLVVLRDDRRFFPVYDAVWLYRLDAAGREPRILAAIDELAGKVDQATMIRANAGVVIRGQSFEQSAEALLAATLGHGAGAPTSPRRVSASVLRNTLQHLKLVAASLAAAILFGVPLGILATRSPTLATLILSLAGILQTIPSLALLALLIPLLGIGVAPALAALFLYSLLPIVRNTFVGLASLPPALTEAAAAIGLSARAQLLSVRLPMASPAIMAGIKTSAVINVGTATLAALIGAGGLGEPILTGIQLRQNSLILEGAIPAAVLALLVERGFGLVDQLVIPKGLRVPPRHE